MLVIFPSHVSTFFLHDCTLFPVFLLEILITVWILLVSKDETTMIVHTHTHKDPLLEVIMSIRARFITAPFNAVANKLRIQKASKKHPEGLTCMMQRTHHLPPQCQ